DRDRNMVSFEPSLHSGFGTGVVMADLGFIFNCRGDYYSLVAGEANALLPGKRPRSTLQSTLVMKSNQPFMIVGSPGGDDQVFRTMQTLLNVVDFGMNVQEAIEAPRWATRSFPASPFPHTMYPGEMSVEARVPEAVRAALSARGHKLKVGGPWTMGSLAAIVAVPRRTRRSVGDRFDQRDVDLVEVLGGLAIDRLVQIVRRRVVALGAPALDHLVLRRSLCESHFQRNRRHTGADEAVLIAAHE